MNPGQNNKFKITNSLEWAALDIELTRKTSKLEYGCDVRKMIRNIQTHVDNLSRAEVEKRLGRSNKVDELITKINNDIELVNEYLLMASLIGQRW